MFAFFSSSEIISSPSANKIFSEDFILSENTVSQFITIPCYVQHLFLLNQENNIFCFSAKETHKSFTLYYRQFTGAGFVFYICLLRFLHVIFHERHIISSRKFFLGGTNLPRALTDVARNFLRSHSEALIFSIDNLNSKYSLNVSLEKDIVVIYSISVLLWDSVFQISFC